MSRVGFGVGVFTLALSVTLNPLLSAPTPPISYVPDRTTSLPGAYASSFARYLNVFRSPPNQVLLRCSRARHRRAGVLVALVVALVILQIVVISMTGLNAEVQRRTPSLLDAPKAYYAAESGANMALAEIYANSDRDGDGVIGTLSNDGNASNNPIVNGVPVCVLPASSSYGSRYRATTQAGSVYQRIEYLTEVAESFENYPTTTALTNVGGWAPWDNVAGATAYTSTAFARSGTQSVRITPTSDLVKSFSITSGTVTLSIWQYIPSSTTGTDHYLILLNTYTAGGTKYWSTQMRFILSSNTVTDNMGGGGTVTNRTISRDRWVRIVNTINLGSNTQLLTYDGNTVYSGPWIRSGGSARFGAIDLYGSSATNVYYDDFQVTQSGVTPSTRVTAWNQVAPTP